MIITNIMMMIANIMAMTTNIMMITKSTPKQKKSAPVSIFKFDSDFQRKLSRLMGKHNICSLHQK